MRDPERARALKEQGVRVRSGDFTDPASLAHAFEGASKVLIVSTDSTGEAAVRHVLLDREHHDLRPDASPASADLPDQRGHDH